MKEYYLFYSIPHMVSGYPEFTGPMFEVEVRLISYVPSWECNFYTNLERHLFNISKRPTQRLGKLIFENRKVNIDRSFTIGNGNNNEGWSIEEFVKHYLEIKHTRIKPRYWLFET